MVKCLPDLNIFTAFLKNKNIIFKIRRSKVTDYAALMNVKMPTIVDILTFMSRINFILKSS